MMQKNKKLLIGIIVFGLFALIITMGNRMKQSMWDEDYDPDDDFDDEIQVDDLEECMGNIDIYFHVVEDKDE